MKLLINILIIFVLTSNFLCVTIDGYDGEDSECRTIENENDCIKQKDTKNNYDCCWMKVKSEGEENGMCVGAVKEKVNQILPEIKKELNDVENLTMNCNSSFVQLSLSFLALASYFLL